MSNPLSLRSPATFSYRIISFLNFVSFPYERLSLSLFLSPSTLLYDYSRYTRLTQLYLGPYDVSLTLPTPWRDAALRRKASKSRNILFILLFFFLEMERWHSTPFRKGTERVLGRREIFISGD